MKVKVLRRYKKSRTPNQRRNCGTNPIEVERGEFNSIVLVKNSCCVCAIGHYKMKTKHINRP